jgi:hypothetical protein
MALLPPFSLYAVRNFSPLIGRAKRCEVLRPVLDDAMHVALQAQ